MLSTLLELLGFALVAAAACLVAVPLGVAVAGVELVLVGYLLGRGESA